MQEYLNFLVKKYPAGKLLTEEVECYLEQTLDYDKVDTSKLLEIGLTHFSTDFQKKPVSEQNEVINIVLEKFHTEVFKAIKDFDNYNKMKLFAYAFIFGAVDIRKTAKR